MISSGRSEAVKEAIDALKEGRRTDSPEQKPTSKDAEKMRKLRAYRESTEREKNCQGLDQGRATGTTRDLATAAKPPAGKMMAAGCYPSWDNSRWPSKDLPIWLDGRTEGWRHRRAM